MARMDKRIYRHKPSSVSSSNGAGRGSMLAWLSKTRVQLLGGLVLAVLLPLFLRLLTIGGTTYVLPVELFLATGGTLMALLTGFILLRLMIVFPGTQAVSYILISFSITYLACILIFFFLRIDYSRFQFLASFGLSQIWFHAVYLISERANKPTFAVVQAGDTKGIEALPQINVVRLTDPNLERVVADGVIVDLRADLSDAWEHFLAKTALKGLPVYHVKQIVESLTGRVEIEALSENSLGSVVPSLLYAKLKRLADLVSALLILPFFALVILIAVVIVRVQSKGKVFFIQPRLGHRGVVFNMIKIRTMFDTKDGDENHRSFTEKNDPRIIPIGRFLRKYRIDEFPQIWNIIKGDMSWIGPRPEAIELATWYEKEIPFYIYRHIVHPGITGWAQVNQGNVAEVEAATLKLQYDFYYIKHLSLWLDLLIVAKTVRTVLSGFGSK